MENLIYIAGFTLLSLVFNYFYLKSLMKTIVEKNEEIVKLHQSLRKEKVAHFETGISLESTQVKLERLEKAFDEAEGEFDELATQYLDLKERNTHASKELNRVRANLRNIKIRK